MIVKMCAMFKPQIEVLPGLVFKGQIYNQNDLVSYHENKILFSYEETGTID